MALGDTIKNFLFEVVDIFTTPLKWGLEWGAEAVLDAIGKGLAKSQSQLLDTMLAQAELPEEVKQQLRAAKEGGGEWQALLGNAVSGSAIGASTGSFLTAALRGFTQAMNRLFLGEIPDITTLLSGWRRGVISDDTLSQQIMSQGFDGFKVDWFKEVTHILLTVDALRQLLLRGEITEERVKEELEKQGWDRGRATEVIKLFWIIPSAPDLIRMAVREAFTPEIVAKFQTDADFPPEFAEWAKKQGLSLEWALNYWRAHWDLPSSLQGFEMLHRGVIDRPELDVLLRTLDVMPYWRDRLVQIAYRPFTRVDVRRMHAIGVLGRDAVKRAYLDIGYDEEKANTMADFTIRYNATDDRELTKTDVLTLYRKGVLTEDDARESLVDLGYTAEDVDYLMAREDVQGSEAVRELSLTQVKKLALAGLIDKTEATVRLADRGYSTEDIEHLYTLWELETEPQDRLPTRTDLEKFYKAGVIDIDAWIDGMYQLRYPEEVIGWFYLLMTSS